VGSGQLAGVVSQYEALRNAAFGHVLPPEARCGLMLFLRRGMWAWTQVMSVPRTGAQQEQTTSLRFPSADESRTAIYVFAAMAMNDEHRGATQ
jgi:hypothetical protein